MATAKEALLREAASLFANICSPPIRWSGCGSFAARRTNHQRDQGFRWMTPCECNNSSLSWRHATCRTSVLLHIGQLQGFLHCPHRDTCQDSWIRFTLCGQSQDLLGKTCLQRRGRLSSGTIRTASSRTLPSSVHTLYLDDFLGPMMLLKIESVRAGSDSASQCFRKIAIPASLARSSSECGGRAGQWLT